MKVQISSNQSAVECRPRRIRRLVRQTLRQEGRDADLSIALVDDGQIADLNRRYLGRDDVTDVLAFPYGTGEGGVEGEIVVNAELAARRAADGPHGPEGELMLYIVHGLLHLLGYDDHGESDILRMREREQAALSAAGYEVEF